MKNKIRPTDIEKTLKNEDFIVSKTDVTGRITYCNRIFMALSGYSERELLGSQHNIVRHPDMPRAIFHLLWDTLKQGGDFFGYIKNLCKDGGYYWVFANLTPTLDTAGNVVGYYSVRRHPEPAGLEVIKPLYREMLSMEQRSDARQAIERSRAILDQRLSEYRADYAQFILQL